MKVVILCGGLGTRLREETEFKPKPLVEIGGKPILWHIMKIYSHYGYKDFVLCLGYKGEMIRDYFLHFREMMHDFTLKLGQNPHPIIHHKKDFLEDWNITFVDTGLQANTGARVYRIREYLEGDEDFFLPYGDGVARIDIPKSYQHHKAKGKLATVTAIKFPTFFGVLNTKNEASTTFEEKPVLDGRVSGGFFVCNKKILDYLSDDDACVFEEQLQKIAAQGQLAAYEHDDFWHTVNTHKDWEEINAMNARGHTPWKIWEEGQLKLDVPEISQKRKVDEP